MTPSQPTDAGGAHQDPFRWPRCDAVGLLDQALHQDDPASLRAFAAEHDVPYSTLRYWQKRRDLLDAPDPLRDFFESPAGLEFLNALVLAAHLVFRQSGACGIRTLTLFFEYARLRPFLACSFGPHQRLAGRLQDLLIL
jgi:hypothetical protein